MNDDLATQAGQRQGFRLCLDGLAFRVGEASPRLDRNHLVRSSPGPRLLPRPAPRRARHAWSWLASPVFVGDQQLAIDSVEQEICVAAREEPSRRRGGGRRPEAPLVAGQDPPIPDRRLHGHDLPGERIRMLRGPQHRRSRPTWRRRGRRRPEDMQIPARELQSSLAWIDLGPRNGPDHRQSCAPSQRIRTVPVGAAYRNALGWTPTPRPASSYLIRGRRGTRAGERRCPRRGAGPSRRREPTEREPARSRAAMT